MRVKITFTLLVILVNNSFAQIDYSNLNNWAYHPSKTSSLINGYNMDIAVIDEQLQIDSIIPIPNNSMINTGVDVFFVHPTVLSGTYFTADTVSIANQPSFLINTTIIAQGGLLSKYGRFFAPRYRQSTPPTYSPITSKSTQAKIIQQSYQDIKNSFLYYLSNYNNGNKIILAGHSQGAYLLGMLLRDVFDNNPNLLAKLTVASLGGMNFIYASAPSYSGGWWVNIPLCTQIAQCGCIQNWTSFKEGQSFPRINTALPAFNQELVNSGLVYQLIDTLQHRFVQDSLIYNTQSQPLRYYITPDAQYQYSSSTNFVAFDSLYNVRFRRDSPTELGLNISYNPPPNDKRPNELLALESDAQFDRFGYHSKDYHIYLWALMQQIDAKIQCSATVSTNDILDINNKVMAYPNPSDGILYFKSSLEHDLNDKQYSIYDISGRLMASEKVLNNMINLSSLLRGIYFLRIENLEFKIIKIN